VAQKTRFIFGDQDLDTDALQFFKDFQKNDVKILTRLVYFTDWCLFCIASQLGQCSRQKQTHSTTNNYRPLGCRCLHTFVWATIISYDKNSYFVAVKRIRKRSRTPRPLRLQADNSQAVSEWRANFATLHITHLFTHSSQLNIRQLWQLNMVLHVRHCWQYLTLNDRICHVHRYCMGYSSQST